jgi:hypothetical protein
LTYIKGSSTISNEIIKYHIYHISTFQQSFYAHTNISNDLDNGWPNTAKGTKRFIHEYVTSDDAKAIISYLRSPITTCNIASKKGSQLSTFSVKKKM